MDIWALAVVFHRIFTGMFLFCDDPGYELRRIVEILGKLPEPYWSSWSKRSMHFDDEGKSLDLPTQRPIRKPFSEEIDSGLKRFGGMGDEERVMVIEMQKRMVIYEPEKRIRADELVKCPWFVNDITSK